MRSGFSKSPEMTFRFLLLSALIASASAAEPFRISQVAPEDGAAGVPTSAAVQAHVSRRFDAATVTADAARVLGPGGEVVATKIAGDLGGVITLSPDAPLEPETDYRVEVTDRVRAEDGTRLIPFRSTFRTGKREERAASDLPRFRAVKLDSPAGATAVTFAPDGRLYVATWDGEIFRYEVDASTGRTGGRQTVWKRAISVRPDEPLIRIVEGAHYGQPNPAMGFHTVQGGIPTEGEDPWEIADYPVGVKPDQRFDPDLLIYNLATIGGPSANGCAEWRGDGPLKGRLLICFYTSARTIHTFAFSGDGKRVENQEPILATDGNPLKFSAPLDLSIDSKHGRIYVIDFADPRRGDSAKEGALWLAEPDGGK